MNANNLSKAIEIWDSLSQSERFGVQFGMFPAEKMPAKSEGYDDHEVTVALMKIAGQGRIVNVDARTYDSFRADAVQNPR
jgi:hypothetical protein